MADKLRLSTLALLAHSDFETACGGCGEEELMVERELYATIVLGKTVRPDERVALA
jgi:hypothetical protein